MEKLQKVHPYTENDKTERTMIPERHVSWQHWRGRVFTNKTILEVDDPLIHYVLVGWLAGSILALTKQSGRGTTALRNPGARRGSVRDQNVGRSTRRGRPGFRRQTAQMR